jgi:hypothetical protein
MTDSTAGVARARADLEDFLATLEHQGFRHEGNDVGLGNRLFSGYRERRILISEFTKVLRQKQFARHLAHCVQDELIAHAAGDNVSLDHFGTERRE